MAGMEDDFREYMEAVFAAASDMYQTLIAQYIADQLDEALSSGGSLYEVIMAGAIAGAMAWYGMYSPEVYQREYSMASESNIQIIFCAEHLATRRLFGRLLVLQTRPTFF